MPKLSALVAAGAAAFTVAVPVEAQPTPRGRIHLDTAFYDDDVVPLHDGIRVRRARIGVQGNYGDDWSYQSEIDFAENGVEFKDMWLRHNDVGGGRLQIGQFKVPFSLEQLTSSNNITFMERSQADMFAPARRLGLGWSRTADRYTVTLMGFGQEIGTAREGGDDGFGAAARVTFLGTQNDSGFFHVGLAVVNYQPTHSNDPTMRFRQRPESRPAGTRLIDTGTISDVDSTLSYGVELAWVGGPLTFQTEYMSARVKRDGFLNPTFSGSYATVSYFLTGESRGYSNGVLTGPRLGNPSGAWELALRYSESDLDDGIIQGGTMENVTLGVNWYPRSNVRFIFNYVNVTSTRLGVDDDPSIYQLRAQVSF